MSVLMKKYPTYNVVFNSEEPKTHLAIDLKLKKDMIEDCDFDLNIDFDYKLFLKEFDKTIYISSNILTKYEDKKVNVVDISLNYKDVSPTMTILQPLRTIPEESSFIEDEDTIPKVIDESVSVIDIETTVSPSPPKHNIDRALDLAKETNGILCKKCTFVNDASSIQCKICNNMLIEEQDDDENYDDMFIIESETEPETEEDEKYKNASVNGIVSKMNDLIKKLENNVVDKKNMKNDDPPPSLPVTPKKDEITDFIGKEPKTKSRVRNSSVISDTTNYSSSSSSSSNRTRIIMSDDYKKKKVSNMKVEKKLVELLTSQSLIKIEPVETLSNIEQDIIKNLYHHLRLLTYTDHNSITKNIIYVITELMKFLNNFNIKKDQEKEAIQIVLKQFLEEEKYDQKEIDYIINSICPEFIDILHSVDERKIVIKKKCQPLFPLCC